MEENYGKAFKTPLVIQLLKNFRSHSKILNLANSVVSLLELLFPKTVDKMLKETSELDGPKPVIIESCTEKKLS
jgi:superfamily I DNA/RNA helicase